jgi:hypothetical protein
VPWDSPLRPSLLFSLLGNAEAFQWSPTPRPKSLRHEQLPLAASYSAFEDSNSHNNGNGGNDGNNRQSSNSRSSYTECSFAEKRSIESRLNRLVQTAAATLQGFYEPHLLSFSIRPGSATVSDVIQYSDTVETNIAACFIQDINSKRHSAPCS